jgi:hypothetical protein
MFFPGSGSLHFSSRIPGVKKNQIPDPTVHKKRDEKQNQCYVRVNVRIGGEKIRECISQFCFVPVPVTHIYSNKVI